MKIFDDVYLSGARRPASGNRFVADVDVYIELLKFFFALEKLNISLLFSH